MKFKPDFISISKKLFNAQIIILNVMHLQGIWNSYCDECKYDSLLICAIM
jgi:hypothetical protein